LASGTTGEIEALLTAYEVTGERAHLEAARKVGGWLVRTAQRRGGYGLCDAAGIERAGLMQGLAGLGLTLLRLSDPEHCRGALHPLI
jgi:lantibiotic modifying enzyme